MPAVKSLHDLNLVQKIESEKDLLPLLNYIFNYGHKNGLSPVDICKVVTATSELGTNLCKYAINGEITVSIFDIDHEIFASVTSKDSGPGIKNIQQAVEDNYTTGNTLGLGLSAVKRLMDQFELESSEKGTIVKVTKKVNVEK
ncbi:MAG: hypothetical protein CME62_06855 [Halobacteriovoraceae bacterium]|nr:hypothetical protein [Halobacteriovoraceae bacterium]